MLRGAKSGSPSPLALLIEFGLLIYSNILMSTESIECGQFIFLNIPMSKESGLLMDLNIKMAPSLSVSPKKGAPTATS